MSPIANECPFRETCVPTRDDRLAEGGRLGDSSKAGSGPSMSTVVRNLESRVTRSTTRARPWGDRLSAGGQNVVIVTALVGLLGRVSNLREEVKRLCASMPA
jgi:hypothetical protein